MDRRVGESMEIIEGNRPGLVGEIVRWHGLYYVRALGWPQIFETLCADQLAEIAKNFGVRDDVTAFSGWRADEFLGSVVMDARPGERAGCRLRFFIASDAGRGGGVGSRLLERSIEWSRQRGDAAVWLTTVAGLGASSHLYGKFGFVMLDERTDQTWGSEHREQLWELKLS